MGGENPCGPEMFARPPSIDYSDRHEQHELVLKPFGLWHNKYIKLLYKYAYVDVCACVYERERGIRGMKRQGHCYWRRWPYPISGRVHRWHFVMGHRNGMSWMTFSDVNDVDPLSPIWHCLIHDNIVFSTTSRLTLHYNSNNNNNPGVAHLAVLISILNPIFRYCTHTV